MQRGRANRVWWGVAAAGLLLSASACTEEAVKLGRFSGAPYAATPPAPDYLARTSWLWTIDDGSYSEGSGIFFNLTAAAPSEQAPQSDAFWPTILVRTPEGWQAVDFRKEFSRYMWSRAAAAPSKGYFWGLLEYAVESAGHESLVIMSADGGKTWTQTAALEKPDEDAVLRTFEINTQGRGQLQWISEKSSGSGARTVTTYVTRDWGRTWRKAPASDLSALLEGQPPPENFPCWVAVKNLPEPLPEQCLFPERLYAQFGEKQPPAPHESVLEVADLVKQVLDLPRLRIEGLAREGQTARVTFRYGARAEQGQAHFLLESQGKWRLVRVTLGEQ